MTFAGWAEIRVASSVSAAFILVNSLASLAGQAASLPLWAFAAAAGRWLGSEFGRQVTCRFQMGIMVIAGLRVILGVLLS